MDEDRRSIRFEQHRTNVSQKQPLQPVPHQTNASTQRPSWSQPRKMNPSAKRPIQALSPEQGNQRQTPPMRKQKRRSKQPPVQRPLSPEAERLRQKRLRAKMRKRRRRRRLLMLVTTVALIAACIVVCCKLLFQVNGVRLEIGEQKFHYVLPSVQPFEQEEDASEHTDATEESEAASDTAASETQSSSTEQQEQQPTPSPQPTQPPEIMHQGAKEVGEEQPLDQTGYTVGTVVELLQVQAGENLFELDLEQMMQAVEKQCPYLENVAIRYKLPNTLAVGASIAVPTFCVQLDEGWAVLSANQKVIDISSSQPQSLVVLELGKITAELGTQLVFEPDAEPVDEAGILGQENLTEEERIAQLEQEKQLAQELAQEDALLRARHLENMLSLLEKWGIREDVTRVSVSDSMELQFWYQDRILVKLGTENELSYKIQFTARILTQELSVSDKGQLDASAIQESGELRPVFSRSIG